MAVESQLSHDGKTLTIKLRDRFDFSQHKGFRDAYNKHKVTAKTFNVDLSATDYMDSAALGMLLVLKEFAENNKARVVLQPPSPAIKKILTIVNFDKLFQIE